MATRIVPVFRICPSSEAGSTVADGASDGAMDAASDGAVDGATDGAVDAPVLEQAAATMIAPANRPVRRRCLFMSLLQ